MERDKNKLDNGPTTKLKKEFSNIDTEKIAQKYLDSAKSIFTLAYGTATGNAKAIALEIAQSASKGSKVRGPMELNDLATESAFAELSEIRVLVIVCSTTGDGEVPECAARFYRKLRLKLNQNRSEETKKNDESIKEEQWLSRTRYAILGLGDSNYSQFNAAARKLDDILTKLGATKFYYTGMADDGTGLEDVVEPWKNGVIKEIHRIWPQIVEEFASQSQLQLPNIEDLSVKNNSPEASMSNASIQKIENRSDERERSSHLRESSREREIFDRSNSDLGLSSFGDLDPEAVQMKRTDSLHNLMQEAKLKVSERTLASITSSSEETQDNDPYLRLNGNRKIIAESTNGLPYSPSCSSPGYNSIKRFRIHYLDSEEADRIRKAEDPIFSQRFYCIQDLHGSGNASRPDSVSPRENPIPKEVEMDFNLNLGRIKPFPSVGSKSHAHSYDKNAPFLATLSRAYFLTTSRSSKNVIHLELRLPNGVYYQTGDLLCIYVPNPDDLVYSLLRRINVDKSYVIDVKSITDALTTRPLPHIYSPATVENIFRYCMELRAVPHKSLIRALSCCCSNVDDQRALEELAASTRKVRNGTILDLLEQFPSCEPSLELLLMHIPPLKPRQYSITSCPYVHPEHVHICFRVMRYIDSSGSIEHAKTRHKHLDGLCTMWLYNLCKESGMFARSNRIGLGLTHCSNPSAINNYKGFIMDDSFHRPKIPVYFKAASNFTLPRDDPVYSNLIMIGPGTGVSPFRGFLQDREYSLQVMKKSHGSALACMGAWRDLDITLEDEANAENWAEEKEYEEDDEFIANGWEESKLTKTGQAVLFFGCRNPTEDFLYEADWNHFQKIGALTDFSCAFSRVEKGRKIYVQDKIREKADMIANLILKEHAYVYVCGDASAMAKDVETSIVEVLSLHSDMVMHEAKRYVNQMQISGRYRVDIWSTVAPFMATGNTGKDKKGGEL